ncbi:hypothetical protein IE4771_PD00430 (plasmid) [Rhizobium etli bv. mimosae str. IE4771]|uniref:Uncharacterized protein n=1 Tax=Rhizobium etli bv. mimosae str. IE4771 TaxID=1432050 RepID=A0A060IG71_RHIET|nr:hypothetical protein IE4771_PD00430 [Rhizobium sp. IE4771]
MILSKTGHAKRDLQHRDRTEARRTSIIDLTVVADRTDSFEMAKRVRPSSK